MEDIQWLSREDVSVGYVDHSDICVKRRDYFVRMYSGSACLVATVMVTINPFPGHGRSVYCSHEQRLFRPGAKYPAEETAIVRAGVEAGVWLGRMLERTGHSELWR